MLTELDQKILDFKKKYPEKFEKIKSDYMKINKMTNKPFSDKTIKSIINLGIVKWLNGQPKEVLENYERNKKLIVLSKETIPQEVQDNILEAYKNSKPVVDKVLIDNYLKSRNMASMYKKVNDFLPKKELYF
jgi:3-dehydroquinate synthetase